MATTLRKTCTCCRELKDPEEFYPNTRVLDGLHYYCIDCAKAKAKTWRANNLEQARLITRKSLKKYHLKKYGLDNAKYAAMVAAQNGLCKICEKPFKRPSVDHCHATGTVRGILCRHCNSSLSVFEKDHSAVLRLIEYLGIVIPQSGSKPKGFARKKGGD